MTKKQEETLAILFAMFVLFTALLNPLLSAFLALITLFGYLLIRNYRNKRSG